MIPVLVGYCKVMLRRIVIGMGWILPLKLTIINNMWWWWIVLLLWWELMSMQFSMEFGDALWPKVA